MIASVKFMLPNSTDELFVSVKSFKEGLFDPAKVKFIASSGKEYDAVYNNDKKGWTINLLGSNDNDGYSLYVVHQTGGDYATLAKLSVYSYLPKTVKLKLVPVNGFSNGFTAKTLSDELNKIYGKVGITCQVEITAPFNYEPLAGKALDVTGSGLLSVFTDDMKLLNTAYIAENPNETGAVLFIIEKATGTEKGTVYGDMPRGKQFGYLFGGASAQTIAHEIGHGLFKLEHPFDRAVTANSFAEGDLKDNLMEYYGGTSLVKLQWDAIHKPGTVIGIFERDEDAMWATDGHYYTVQLIAQMLGLSKSLAVKLGEASEHPDSHVHSETNMQEKDTWIIGGQQQKYHALTGGYHGVELAITAYALTKTHTDENSLYYLLHRFGDDFAHFDIKYDKQGLTYDIPLQQYIDALEAYLNKFIDSKFIINPYLETMPTPYGNIPYNKFLKPFIIHENGKLETSRTKDEIKKNIIDFLLNADHDGFFAASLLTWQYFQDEILKNLPQAIQNKFKMYGGTQFNLGNILNCFTFGHTSDKSAPDNIVDRRDLFLLYVDGLMDLLSIKYDIQDIEANKNKIKLKLGNILDYLKYSSIDRLDGILAYEFTLLNNPNSNIIYFYIPVKYTIGQTLSSKGKLFNATLSDFDGDANNIKEDTLKYLDKVGAYGNFYITEALKKDNKGIRYWEIKLEKK